jgi:hypothetical protein
LVGWNGRCIDSIADTSDCSPNDELSHCFVTGYGRDLDDDAEDHDKTANDDGAPSSEDITKAELEDGSSEAANLVYCCYEPLPRRVASRLGKCIVELGCGDDSRHDALIISILRAVSMGIYMIV